MDPGVVAMLDPSRAPEEVAGDIPADISDSEGTNRPEDEDPRIPLNDPDELARLKLAILLSNYKLDREILYHMDPSNFEHCVC